MKVRTFRDSESWLQRECTDSLFNEKNKDDEGLQKSRN